VIECSECGLEHTDQIAEVMESCMRCGSRFDELSCQNCESTFHVAKLAAYPGNKPTCPYCLQKVLNYREFQDFKEKEETLVK